MKINRFLALGLIALLVIGAIGVFSQRSLAQSETPTAVEDCSAETEDDGAAEAAETGPDLDDVQEGCNQEDENETEDSDRAEEAEDVPSAATALTADDAQAIAEAANPGAAALEVEFELEDGVESWEVELDNGQEILVDANSGEILLTRADD